MSSERQSVSPARASLRIEEVSRQHENISIPSSRSTLHSIFIISTALGTMILQTSGETSVAIAVPTIGKSLHIPPSQLQWLVTSFALSSGCLLLMFGRIADLYGRKRVYLCGVLCNLAFTLGCSFSRDPPTIFILRALQGLGLSAAMPAAAGMLAQSFPPSKLRGIAFSTFSAGAPLGAALGMSLGGALTENLTWRAIFWFSSGLSFLCLLGGYFFFDRDQVQSPSCAGKDGSVPVDRRIDWLGSMAVTIGLVLIVFVLGQAGAIQRRWREPYIPILLCLGVAFMGVFIWWQRHLEKYAKLRKGNNLDRYSHAYLFNPPPLLPLSLLGRDKGRYAAIMVICFLNAAGFLAWNFWIQLFYQDYLHLRPLQTVVRLIPMFVVGVLCNVLVAWAVNRVPVVVILGIGTTFTSVACLLIAIIEPSQSYWAYEFPSSALIVFGADFMFAAGSIYVANVSQPQEQSVSQGIFQTMMSVGSATGVALSTLAWDAVARQHFDEEDHSPGSHHGPSLDSYQNAMWVAFGAASAATVLVFAFFWKVGVVGHRPPQPSSTEKEAEPAP